MRNSNTEQSSDTVFWFGANRNSLEFDLPEDNWLNQGFRFFDAICGLKKPQ